MNQPYKYTMIMQGLIFTSPKVKWPANFIGMIKHSEEIGKPTGTLIFTDENGQIHREDGPAVIYPEIGPRWYLNNKRYDFLAYLSDLKNIRQRTSEEIEHIKSQWKV